MIADIEANKNLSPIVLARERKLHILLVFILQSYFKVPKTLRLNAVHYFIEKIPNKRELHQIALNYLSDIEFKRFTKISIKNHFHFQRTIQLYHQVIH